MGEWTLRQKPEDAECVFGGLCFSTELLPSGGMNAVACLNHGKLLMFISLDITILFFISST